MASSSNVQTSFAGGVWSKTAQGRYDLTEDYKQAMAVCQNGLPIETRAWTRRPGTKYAGHTKAGNPGKLVTFDFADNAPYQLEFTANAIRLREGISFVFDSEATITDITSGLFTTSAAHGWSVGDEVVVFGDEPAAIYPLFNRQLRLATVPNTDEFTIVDALDGSAISLSAWSAPGTNPTVKRIQQITTEYGSESWSGVEAVRILTRDQKAGAVLLSEQAPQFLEVVTEPDDGTEEPAEFDLDTAFLKDGPYLDPVAGGTLATPSALLGIINVTLSFPAYSSTKAYAKGDYVTSSSVNYKSIQDANVNHTPASSATWWEVVASDDAINNGDGLTGSDIGRSVRLFSEPANWAVGTAYTAGNVVKYNDGYWTALTSTTGDIPGNNTTDWTPTPGNAAIWSWGRITALLTEIDRALAGSANIGDMSSQGGLAAAFDGEVSQSSTQGAADAAVASTSLAAYVGKDYSGASAQAISSATLFPSTDYGVVRPETGTSVTTITVNLRAKATTPASGSDGTLLGTTVVTGNTTLPIVVTSNDVATTWDFVWFEILATVAATIPFVPAGGFLTAAEVKFFNPPGGATNGFSMEVLGDSLLYSAAIRVWRLGLYSATTGYPRAGTWHEGRLWLAGVAENRIDSSKSNDPFNFAPTGPTGEVADDNAISYTFNSKSRSPIYWLESTRQGIVVGTLKGEWLVQATNQNLALTPTTIQAHQDTAVGAADIAPVRADHSLLYVQKQQRQVMEYFADAYSGKYTAPNIAERAKHLTNGGIEQVVYHRQSLAPVLWMYTGSGALIGCTYKRTTMTTAAPPELMGWHNHTLGSGFAVENLSVGPDPDTPVDSLFLVAYNEDSGYRHVEVLSEMVEEDAAIGTDWLLDMAVEPLADDTTESAINGVRLYGLYHLEGTEATVYAGGLDLGDFEVEDGSCFVPYTSAFTQGFAATATIIVGYTYTSRGQLLRPHSQADTGATPIGFAKIRRTNEFGIQLVRSQACKIGTEFTAGKMNALQLRTEGGTAYTSLELYSGIHWGNLQDKYSFDSRLAWEQSRPLPLTIAAIGGFIQTQG